MLLNLGLTTFILLSLLLRRVFYVSFPSLRALGLLYLASFLVLVPTDFIVSCPCLFRASVYFLYWSRYLLVSVPGSFPNIWAHPGIILGAFFAYSLINLQCKIIVFLVGSFSALQEVGFGSFS